MLSRSIALVLGGIWLGVAILFLITGAISFQLITYPCFLEAPLCQTVQDAVVYEVFLGQVAEGATHNVLFWLPISILLIGIPMISGAYHHLRYFFIKDRSAIDALSVMLTAFFLIVLVFLDRAVDILLPSLIERVQAVPDASADWVAVYETVVATLRSSSVLVGVALAALTLLLWLFPEDAPPFVHRRTLSQANQCGTCGLRGDNIVPTCLLCQSYYRYSIPDDARRALQDAVFSTDETIALPIAIDPVRNDVPVQSLIVTLSLGNAFEISTHEPTNWTLVPMVGQRGDYRLEAPTYLTDAVQLNLTLQPTAAVENQLRRRQTYEVKVNVSTPNGSSQTPETVRIQMERDTKPREELLDSTRSVLQERVGEGVSLAGDGLSSVQRIVGEWVKKGTTLAKEQLDEFQARRRESDASTEGDANDDA